MPRHLARLTLTAALSLLVPGTVFAQDAAGVPTAIVAAPNAPVTITRCKVPTWNEIYVTLGNRTSHALLSWSVQIRFIDQDGAVIGQTTMSSTNDTPLQSGDDAVYHPFLGYVALSEPPNAISKITCRIQEAAFSGQRRWVSPQKWPEKLVPLTTAKTESVEGEGSGKPAAGLASPARPTPKVTLSVVNAWNDAGTGVTFVHDALVIAGGDADATVHASDFMLSMALANGARKSYTAIAGPAPRYTKIDPRTGNQVLANEVDPREDLGALGTIVVPAHGTVRATITFVASDPLANPGDNRAVTLK